MKRYFLITETNGKEHQLPFEKIFKDARTGSPTYIPVDIATTHPSLITVCVSLCQEGFCPEIDDKSKTELRMDWIAPSQIKTVTVVIEKTPLKVLTQE